MSAKEWSCSLSLEGIDSCIRQIEQMYDESFPLIPRRELMKQGLKGMLLNLQKHFGEQHDFTVSVRERFGRVHVYLKIQGECYDPRLVSNQDNDYEIFTAELLQKYEIAVPDFQYKNGVNIIHAAQKTKQEKNPLVNILISLTAGIALAVAGLYFSPPLRDNITIILQAINQIVPNLIVMSATPVVFFMVANSLPGFGSIASVKKSGSCLIMSYLWHYLLVTLLIIGYIFTAFDFTLDNSVKGDSPFALLTKSIIGIFPTSYAKPFVDCNFLQIIFIAIAVGFAVLVIGEAAKPFRDLCLSMDTIVNKIMNWSCKLLPLFIFAMIPPLIWENRLTDLSSVFVHFFGITGIALIAFALPFLYTCFKCDLSPRGTLSLLMPPMLQGLMTSSSTSAIPQIKAAIHNFRVKESFNGFAVATGLILGKAYAYTIYVITTFFLVTVSGVKISVSLLTILIFSSFLFSLAGPPSSGGLLAGSIALSAILKIPEGYTVIIVPILLLIDFITTSLRCGSIVINSVLAATKIGEIEK